MISKNFLITSNLGLHLRPASRLCEIARSHQSEVILIRNGVESDAKSILNLLAASVRHMDQITIRCTGSDEEETMEEITALLSGHGREIRT